MLSLVFEWKAYHLLCATLGLLMLGMAANEWRRLRTDDNRRLALSAGLVLLTRLAVLLALLVGWRAEGICLEWLLQGLTLAAFAWAFLFTTFSTSRRAGIFLLVAAGGVGVSAALCHLAGTDVLALPPSLDPGPAALLLLSGFALVQWLRHRRQFSPWLGMTFALSLLGAGSGLFELRTVALVAHLVVLCVLLVESYRAILADLSAYGQELQAVSDRALRQTQHMAFLLEVSQAIASSLELPVVLERVSEAVARAVNADWAYVLLPSDGDEEQLTVAARYGWWGKRWTQDSQSQRQVVVHPSEFSLLRHAMSSRRQVLANQPEDYEQFDRFHDLLVRPQSGPTLIQPILLQDRTLGVMLLGYTGRQETFSGADGRLCQALVGQVATAIDNARLYQSVDEQARRLAELLRTREEEVTQRQAILESIVDGVVVAGQGGEVVLVNAAAERILGLSRTQLMKQTIKWLYARLLQTGGKRGGSQGVFEWGQKMVTGSLAPVKMPDGALLGYVAVFRDVTGEHQAEQAKRDFIATISHELRTPLTSIKGYVQLMTAGAVGSLNPQQRDFLAVVSNATERIISLVNNLISVSELERGPIQIEPKVVDLGFVIEEAVRAVRPQASDCQLDLSLHLPPNLSPILGDADGLRQIMDNLLDNAVRYTPGPGRISIWAAEAHLPGETQAHRDFVVVSVRDTGVGIPAEEHERIFERFYRVDNPLSVEAGGTGMGLAIVKSLVMAHGGRVWVESQPGAGSTFSFTVPTA